MTSNTEGPLPFRIGTSGWNYSQWKEVFYPRGLSSSKWLAYYASFFDTVEVNATFYRTPREKTLKKWHGETPAGFIFSLKASRFITHIKRLREVEEELSRFYQLHSLLEEKAGPVLFQLPPSLKYDPTLWDEFLSLLDQKRQNVVEVRNRSFHDDRFFAQLSERNIALCVSDTAGRYPLFLEVTADFVYLRLHGSRKLYRSCYTEEELKQWAERIQSWRRPGYAYFDNDMLGWAVPNALRLKELLGQETPSLPEEAREALRNRPLE